MVSGLGHKFRKGATWVVIFIGFSKLLSLPFFGMEFVRQTMAYEVSALTYAFSHPVISRDSFWAKKSFIKFNEGQFKEVGASEYAKIEGHHIYKLQFLAGFGYTLYRKALFAWGTRELIENFIRRTLCLESPVSRILNETPPFDRVTLAVGVDLKRSDPFTVECRP